MHEGFETQPWMVMDVYGLIDCSLLDSFKGELDQPRNLWDLPWCVGGDFNKILFVEERRGSRRWTGEWSSLATLWTDRG